MTQRLAQALGTEGLAPDVGRPSVPLRRVHRDFHATSVLVGAAMHDHLAFLVPYYAKAWKSAGRRRQQV